VLAINDTIYWAVSCFNYGDDAVFDRQRYGPAWIITSKDGGVTFNETATPTGACCEKKQRRFFLCLDFIRKKPIICQDRLGTNIAHKNQIGSHN
jgi:hypothetical protein